MGTCTSWACGYRNDLEFSIQNIFLTVKTAAADRQADLDSSVQIPNKPNILIPALKYLLMFHI